MLQRKGARFYSFINSVKETPRDNSRNNRRKGNSAYIWELVIGGALRRQPPKGME